MKKITLSILLSLCLILASVHSISAHVAVKPSSVGIGSWQTFTVGVPVEKKSATVRVRLVIPDGLEHVTPNVKPGWTITVKKTGEGDAATVSEILWEQGSIPVGQRDDFFFSAKVPARVGELRWKAYQTSADGSVVAWEKEPGSSDHDGDFSISGPYSVTKLVDDLATSVPTADRIPQEVDGKTRFLSITAIAISVVALFKTLQSKKE